MKALKIYSIISTVAVIVLSVCLYNITKNYNKTKKEYSKTKKEYKETDVVLKQCSDRYYTEIGK